MPLLLMFMFSKHVIVLFSFHFVFKFCVNKQTTDLIDLDIAFRVDV